MKNILDTNEHNSEAIIYNSLKNLHTDIIILCQIDVLNPYFHIFLYSLILFYLPKEDTSSTQ